MKRSTSQNALSSWSRPHFDVHRVTRRYIKSASDADCLLTVLQFTPLQRVPPNPMLMLTACSLVRHSKSTATRRNLSIPEPEVGREAHAFGVRHHNVGSVS